MAESYLKLHQLLARGEPLPSGDFGVAKFSSPVVNGSKGGNPHLKDHERAAKPPIDGNQANPDHGYK